MYKNEDIIKESKKRKYKAWINILKNKIKYNKSIFIPLISERDTMGRLKNEIYRKE